MDSRNNIELVFTLLEEEKNGSHVVGASAVGIQVAVIFGSLQVSGCFYFLFQYMFLFGYKSSSKGDSNGSSSQSEQKVIVGYSSNVLQKTL